MRGQVSSLRWLAIAVLLGGILAGVAHAGAFYSGQFTLPYEVRWGSTVLSPGEYSLAMDSERGPLRVSDETGRIVLLVYGNVDMPTRGQPSSLLITRDGVERTVRSLNSPVWGHKLVFKAFTRAERDLLARGGQVELLGVRMASR